MLAAAEGPLGVGVPLQERDFHAAAGEQASQGRPGRSRPNDYDAPDRHDAPHVSAGDACGPRFK